MPVNIEDEKTMSMPELKQEIEKIRKRNAELGLRSAKTDEYLKMFVELSPKQGEELKKKLEGLKLSRLKDMHINKIIDLMPITKDDLKLILQGFEVSLSSDDLEKVVEAVKSFVK